MIRFPLVWMVCLLLSQKITAVKGTASCSQTLSPCTKVTSTKTSKCLKCIALSVDPQAMRDNCDMDQVKKFCSGVMTVSPTFQPTWMDTSNMIKITASPTKRPTTAVPTPAQTPPQNKIANSLMQLDASFQTNTNLIRIDPQQAAPTKAPGMIRKSGFPNLQCLMILGSNCKGCAVAAGSIKQANPECTLRCLQCLQRNKVELIGAGCTLAGGEKYCGDVPTAVKGTASPLRIVQAGTRPPASTATATKVRRSRCPGGTLRKCIGECPQNTFEAAFKDCIEECTARCN